MMTTQKQVKIRIHVFMLCNNMTLLKYSTTDSTMEVNGQLHTLTALLLGKSVGSGCFGKEENTISCQSAVQLIA